MLRSRSFLLALWFLSIGIFVAPLLPVNSFAEEIAEELAKESAPSKELPDLDPFTATARLHASQIMGADGISWLAHIAAPLPQHVAEVPVPPPEV